MGRRPEKQKATSSKGHPGIQSHSDMHKNIVPKVVQSSKGNKLSLAKCMIKTKRTAFIQQHHRVREQKNTVAQQQDTLVKALIQQQDPLKALIQQWPPSFETLKPLIQQQNILAQEQALEKKLQQETLEAVAQECLEEQKACVVKQQRAFLQLKIALEHETLEHRALEQVQKALEQVQKALEQVQKALEQVQKAETLEQVQKAETLKQVQKALEQVQKALEHEAFIPQRTLPQRTLPQSEILDHLVQCNAFIKQTVEQQQTILKKQQAILKQQHDLEQQKKSSEKQELVKQQQALKQQHDLVQQLGNLLQQAFEKQQYDLVQQQQAFEKQQQDLVQQAKDLLQHALEQPLVQQQQQQQASVQQQYDKIQQKLEQVIKTLHALTQQQQALVTKLEDLKQQSEASAKQQAEGLQDDSYLPDCSETEMDTEQSEEKVSLKKCHFIVLEPNIDDLIIDKDFCIGTYYTYYTIELCEETYIIISPVHKDFVYIPSYSPCFKSVEQVKKTLKIVHIVPIPEEDSTTQSEMCSFIRKHPLLLRPIAIVQTFPTKEYAVQTFPIKKSDLDDFTTKIECGHVPCYTTEDRKNLRIVKIENTDYIDWTKADLSLHEAPLVFKTHELALEFCKSYKEHTDLIVKFYETTSHSFDQSNSQKCIEKQHSPH